jgi:prevent-host-death family protein
MEQDPMSITEITATEAVRTFSELLNGVRYRGDRYTIVRGGKPVATIGPVESSAPRATLGDLPGLVRDLPRLEAGDDSFDEDIAASVAEQPRLPQGTSWE